MSKRAVLRFATSICLSVSLLLLGQINVFADTIDGDIKPIHEYTFDNDDTKTVYDSGTGIVINFDSSGYSKFISGYNGIGQARLFEGNMALLCRSNSMVPKGQKSIRFKIKKDALTVSSSKTEPIFTTLNSQGGLYIGIGKYDNITTPGSLYIRHQNNTGSEGNSINFEMQTSNSICDGQWHDILFTWDGTTNTNSVKLYIDDMTIPIAQTTANAPDVYSGNIYIGGYTDTVKTTSFIGCLDNLQIYDSAITIKSNTTQPTGNKALLVITMVTGERKEYEMTTDKINDFIAWYKSKAASSPTYMIEKDYNKASFTARKDYIAYEQISNFEVNEYNE
ncbi:LamG domain-containing protein [Lacrimispora amygdalina]|uniref:LamG domain-containing protein n=1 Tax=Lacrimispora amygdalina TaxID=253257 RepID=UPI000BE4345D|nr:LamG domain-containing protein [Lacrimispora amygdalina]